MATAYGKAALEVIKTFRSRKWHHKDFARLTNLLVQEYTQRNEVVKGCHVATGSGSSTRYKLLIDCDAVSGGHVVLQGKMHTVADVTNKDLFNADGDQASLAIAYGNGGTDPASGTYTITSNAITFSVKIYNSTATGEVYDVASSADIQIDKGHTDSTLTADLALIKVKFDALCAAGQKFAGYSSGAVGGADGSAATITLTAPVGHGNNFTDNSGSLANLAGTPTNATVEFGGLIYSDGSSASGIDNSAAASYVSIIATNSDNNGGVVGEGTAIYLMGVVNGTSSSLTQSHCSSDQIQSALVASSSNVNGYKHSGATGWAHVCQVNSTVDTKTFASNLNNHVGA